MTDSITLAELNKHWKWLCYLSACLSAGPVEEEIRNNLTVICMHYLYKLKDLDIECIRARDTSSFVTDKLYISLLYVINEIAMRRCC
mgnify:CR=1 FL=1